MSQNLARETESNTTIPSFTVLERAVLYARVSGDDRHKEGRNLDGQLTMGREYAIEKGYNIVAELAEDDRGASGYKIDLPELNRVREMARAGQFDVLVVREIDRLSRNLAKQLIIEEELRRAGVRIEYVLAEYEDSPEGRLSKHIRATIAEYEREKIRERLVRGREQKVKAGNVFVSDRPPYGYDVLKQSDQTLFEIIEEEACIVRLIFEWYVKGDENGKKLSTTEITKKLTKMKVPTRGDKPNHVKKKSKYGHWNRTTVTRVLSRKTYIGTWHYSKRTNRCLPVQVEPIVSQEIWGLAQLRLQQNIEDARRNLKYDYLLARRCICGHCGYKMTGITKKVKDKKYSYYRCPAKQTVGSTRTCDLPQMNATLVDHVVWNWLEKFLTDPETLEAGLTGFKAIKDEESYPLRQELTVIEDLIDQHNKDLKQALSDLRIMEQRNSQRAKTILLDDIQKMEKTLDHLEAQRNFLTKQLTTRSLSDEQIQGVKAFAAEISQDLQTFRQDFEGRSLLIKMFDVRVTLKVEDNIKIAYVECRLGGIRLPIDELEYYGKVWYNGDT
jgi:site-specific DNA recombinase